jgi:carbohydrate-selective porin OprB
MMKHKFGIGTISSIALAVSANVASGQTASENPDDGTGKGLVSILDVAPESYFAFKRMPKYFSDPNMDLETVDGRFFERQYLLGSFGGLRTRMAENGLIFDAGVTQVFQHKSSGDGDGSASAGSADIWVALDTGRAGWWSGGLIVSHMEGNWGDVLEGTGALLPLNADATMPSAPDSIALSELYLVQALPHEFTLIAGKVDWAGTADTSLFANNERSQFLHEGLINNAVLGAFVPYTSIGAALAKQLTPELSATLVAFSNNSSATVSGFDTFDLDEFTYAFTMGWMPTFGNLPGNYNFILGGSNKDVTDFDVDSRYLVGELIGAVPPAEKTDNYAFTLSASQYLWVNESTERWDGRPAGIGAFFRYGTTPEDRNLIDGFYSLGLGGTIGPFGRSNDSWGIGWAGTHISSDFRRDADLLGASVDSMEHAYEGYYSLALTPAITVSGHIQYVDPANSSADELTALSARIQIDF